MKFLAWIQMSILVALVISWPLVLCGMSKEVVGAISLLGGALVMLGRRRPRPPG
jgi:hypothetical protein